ncbi:MAG: ribbon-helix-helix protein, CopG family [Oxalobacter sp.]|nr:MAG: ribbon-helix-helix protein, CopG family [Oxalobacter sp.]
MTWSIRLAPDMGRRLDALAVKTGRSKSACLRRIIETGIQEMEDYYLSAEVLERVRNGQERVYSAAEVRKDFEGSNETGGSKGV